MLGSVGVYPEVWCTPCGRSARGGDLTFFFPGWSRALATIQEHSGDWLYAVEFLDAFGNMIHKVCLTPESDSEAFRWWVELNHAANPAAELSPYARFASRVDDSDAHCADDASLLSENDFRALLRRSVEAETSVQILVANEGLAQGARMAPNCLRDDGDWIYLGNDICGLQLRIGRPSDISFRWSSSSSDWVLKAYESEAASSALFAEEMSKNDFLFGAWEIIDLLSLEVPQKICNRSQFALLHPVSSQILPMKHTTLLSLAGIIAAAALVVSQLGAAEPNPALPAR